MKCWYCHKTIYKLRWKDSQETIEKKEKQFEQHLKKCPKKKEVDAVQRLFKNVKTSI